MANEYIQVEQLKATLELTGNTFANEDIEAAIKGASRGIDNACHRRFWLDDDDTSVRYFHAISRTFIPIDDLVDLDELATDPGGDQTFEDTWTANTDFLLEPLNAAADGWPYTSISPRLAGDLTRFPTIDRAIRVTGQFGWPAVPDPIVEATTILASKLLRRAREAPFGVVSAGIDVGVVMRIARTDPDVHFLINPYTRGQLLLV